MKLIENIVILPYHLQKQCFNAEWRYCEIKIDPNFVAFANWTTWWHCWYRAYSYLGLNHVESCLQVVVVLYRSTVWATHRSFTHLKKIEIVYHLHSTWYFWNCYIYIHTHTLQHLLPLSTALWQFLCSYWCVIFSEDYNVLSTGDMTADPATSNSSPPATSPRQASVHCQDSHKLPVGFRGDIYDLISRKQSKLAGESESAQTGKETIILALIALSAVQRSLLFHGLMCA